MESRSNLGARATTNAKNGLRLTQLLICSVFCLCPSTFASGQDSKEAAKSKKADEPNAANDKEAKDAAKQVEPPAKETISEEQLQEKITQVKESSDLSEELRQELVDLYEQAIKQTKAIKTATDQVKQLNAERAGQATNLAEVKSKIDRETPTPKPDSKADLKKLQEELLVKESELAEAQSAVNTAKERIKTRDERKLKLPELITESQKKLDDVRKQLEAKFPENTPAEKQDAQRQLLRLRETALQEQIASLKQEATTYELTGELDRLRQALAVKEAANAEKAVKAWREIVDKRQQQEINRLAKDAKKDVKSAEFADPVIRELAETNQQLADRLQQSGPLLAQTRLARESVNEVLAEIKEDRESLKSKSDVPELKSLIGPLLREQKQELDAIMRRRHQVRDRAAEITKLHYDLTEWKKQETQLTAEFEAAQQAVVDRLAPQAQNDPQHRMKVESLLKDKRTLLSKLITVNEDCVIELVKLNEAVANLLEEATQFSEVVDESILWVRSTVPLYSVERLWPKSREATRWLFSAGNWKGVAGSLYDSNAEVVLDVFVLAFVLLMARQRIRIRRRLRENGEAVRKDFIGTFSVTVASLCQTVLLAVLWPSVLFYAGWRITSQAEGSDFMLAVGRGLSTIAVVYVMLELFRQTCRPMGLGEAHFRWRADTLSVIRLRLYWLISLVLPATFVLSVMEVQSLDEGWTNSVGRFAILVSLCSFAFFLYRICRPQGTVMQDVLRRFPGTWLERNQKLFCVVVTAIPIALAGLSFFGYHYTATQLAWSLLATVGLGLGLLVFNSMIVRWLYTARGKLALEQAEKARAAAADSDSDKQQIAGISTDPGEHGVDLSAINLQTRKLLRASVTAVAVVGLWLIWADEAPALSILDNVELWSRTVEYQEQTTDAEGNVTLNRLGEKIVPTTLMDLLLALLAGVLTVSAQRNVPGLLEISILKKLPLDAGGRYAVTTMARYVIIVVGVVTMSYLIGLQWSKIQWLVAAVSVGLGFGLQEIFANFVSGLILLLERPIRVGDIVTIEGVTGVVSRIQMRATTVTDWDRKDYVVPNREFITGRVLNWTLSNKINRVVVNVGVAYGSDTEKARQLLLKIATDHPLIMKDPCPMATFEGFGDSTLNFVLRCYLPDLEKRLDTIHELHTSIDKAFAQADIEIAFPQRDIHVRTFTGPETLPSPQGNGADKAKAADKEKTPVYGD